MAEQKADKSGPTIKESLGDYATKGLTSALEVYVDTLMKRPSWADIVVTLEDITINLLDDFKSNIIRSFALSLFGKLGLADQRKLAEEMASYLVQSHPSWFPLYGKSDDESVASESQKKTGLDPTETAQP